MRKDVQIINRKYANLLKEFLIERFCNKFDVERTEELDIVFPQQDSRFSGFNIEILIDELLSYLLYERG